MKRRRKIWKFNTIFVVTSYMNLKVSLVRQNDMFFYERNTHKYMIQSSESHSRNKTQSAKHKMYKCISFRIEQLELKGNTYNNNKCYCTFFLSFEFSNAQLHMLSFIAINDCCCYYYIYRV